MAFIRHEQGEQKDARSDLPKTTALELAHTDNQLLENGYPQRGADGSLPTGYWQLNDQAMLPEPRIVAIDCEMVSSLCYFQSIVHSFIHVTHLVRNCRWSHACARVCGEF